MLLLFTGCGRAEPARPRVVTAVRVACGETIKEFTRDDKIRRVLYCLRKQEMAGYPGCDPERQTGQEVRVELQFSDGTSSVCRQRCGRYVSKDLHRWQRMAEEDHRLRYLFYLMKSDTVAKAGEN